MLRKKPESSAAGSGGVSACQGVAESQNLDFHLLSPLLLGAL